MENLMAVWSWLTSVLTTEFFAALAAALSFFVAWRQHVWNKKHHLASIKPFICDFLERDHEKLSLSFSLMNKGLGPAKLVSYEFKWDEKKVSADEVAKFMTKSFTGDFKLYLAEMSNVSAFSAGESRVVMSVTKKNGASIDDLDKEAFSIFNKEIIKRLRLVILYQSIQGKEVFEYRTTPLTSLLNKT
ncbi:hypothetical protein R6Y90_19160 [Alteromonas macleodii]|uniref:hypothetical protein n=1 Tax=Alteromonas macleodii TaxID=28108 RepID=UPI002981929C|nr:hypothetical protein [Alteromonas macleodii]MDW5287069.1 hypothetical protein [Alteromonas macleodii]